MIDLFVVLCVVAIAMPFIAYPLLLWARAHFAPSAIRAADYTPEVDLLIAAHDEEDSIEARIENALSLDYPSDRLRIWVASDGSEDATVAISRRFEAHGVRVLDLPRGGKAVALVRAVDASCGEILAFSDANSHWPPNALKCLLRPFADPTVGGVAGDQRYIEGGSSSTESLGERGYWSFDRVLKRWQSRAGNVVSATGAIYAIRRTCFEAPPSDATDDFMISTGVIAAGQRLVFAEDAIALEPPAESTRGEFRRKVRIITRGLRAVGYRRGLMNPFSTGLYAFELLVHKLWRRLVWLPSLALVLSTPFALSNSSALGWLPLLFFVGALLGTLGRIWPVLNRFRPVALASYVVMVNSACALATLNALRGRRIARWEPERLASPPASSEPSP
jgi:cellulose synthase/poly-beta-1,6-N-acetylglucosamine synthase-like glycosyltransferase